MACSGDLERYLAGLLLNSGSQAAFCFDSDGRLLLHNASLDTLLGYPAQELEGLGVQAISPGFLDVARSLEPSLTTGGSADTRLELRDREGRRVPTVARISLVPSDESTLGACLLTPAEELDYSALVREARDAVFVHDLSGRFLMANRGTCEMLGCSEEDILKMNILDTYAPEERGVGQERLARLRIGQSLRLERMMRRVDGTMFPVEATSVVLADGRVTAIVRDVTVAKEAEKALRESELKFKTVADFAHDWEYWIASDGRLVYISPSCERVTGYTDQEFLAHPGLIDAIVHPDDVAAGIHFRTVARTPAHSVEYRIIDKSGEVRWISHRCQAVFAADGEWLGRRISNRDVTDSRETDRILRLAQFSLDKSLDSVFWLDASAKIIIASDSACRNFGYEREELLSMSIDEIDPTYSEEGWVRYWEMLKREGSFRFESLHRTKAGRVYPVEILAYYLPHEGLEYNCVFARDISEQKMAEAALRDSEEQLRQAQKMEAIGQLAGGIAHDFNNLLTAVIGYSDLLLARKEIADSDAAEDVAEIKKAAERASALTRQILAFSRRQALQPAVVSLESILKGIEPLLRRTLGENVRLDIVAQSDAGNVEIDVHQFEQVIMNLALNARDAMASGGRLTIEASTVELDAEYCRAKLDVPPGPYAMLSVSDTGVGMSEEVLSRAFEPFFTTKAAGAGTGLGLSTVYGIIKQSGGGVAVESEVGKGTTFKVFLPLAEDSSLGVFGQARHAVTMVPAALPLGGETILVVEDEEALRNLTWRVLADVGYRVLLAASADEALPILRDHDGPLDAVLTDVVLPGSMQGNDLAAVVRAQHPGVPVIFMSGYTRDAIGHGGRLEEDVNFIQKPFTPEHVLARVREVLDASKRKPASRRPRPRRPTNQA